MQRDEQSGSKTEGLTSVLGQQKYFIALRGSDDAAKKQYIQVVHPHTPPHTKTHNPPSQCADISTDRPRTALTAKYPILHTPGHTHTCALSWPSSPLFAKPEIIRYRPKIYTITRINYHSIVLNQHTFLRSTQSECKWRCRSAVSKCQRVFGGGGARRIAGQGCRSVDRAGAACTQRSGACWLRRLCKVKSQRS